MVCRGTIRLFDTRSHHRLAQNRRKVMERSLPLLFVQVALGVIIGSFVAQEISVRFAYGAYFWSLGALLGGFVAYVSVDLRQILAGIAHSYRKTIGWRPNRPFWGAYLALLGGVEIAFWTFFGTLYYLLIEKAKTTEPVVLFVFVSALPFAFSLLILCLALPHSMNENLTDEEYVLWLQQRRVAGLKMMLYANPIGALYCLLLGIVWTIVRIPRASLAIMAAVPLLALRLGRGARALWRFAAELFIYVHSERRTRRFLYAAIGVMVGHFFVSAVIGSIVGAVAGGTLAVVSYTLTPVRWLTIAPATRLK